MSQYIPGAPFGSGVHMTPTEAVQEYLGRRWLPLAMVPGTKQPVTKFKNFLNYESFGAIPPEMIPYLLQPWKEDPEFSVGILVKPSELVVVDCDSLEAVREAIANTGEPCENIVQSRNGAHFYYRRPAHCPPLRTVHRGESKKIDIMANGYMVAPPSVHSSGWQYRWLKRGPLQDAPDWVVGLLSTIRDRSIATKLLDPSAVKDAFPNTAAQAMDMVQAIARINPQVSAALHDPRASKALGNDRSQALWLTINTLIRLLKHDRGATVYQPAWLRLKNAIGDVSDETIAKVVWYGSLGSDIIGEKPRQKGWQWFCDEIARARLEIVGD